MGNTMKSIRKFVTFLNIVFSLILGILMYTTISGQDVAPKNILFTNLSTLFKTNAVMGALLTIGLASVVVYSFVAIFINLKKKRDSFSFVNPIVLAFSSLIAFLNLASYTTWNVIAATMPGASSVIVLGFISLAFVIVGVYVDFATNSAIDKDKKEMRAKKIAEEKEKNDKAKNAKPSQPTVSANNGVSVGPNGEIVLNISLAGLTGAGQNPRVLINNQPNNQISMNQGMSMGINQNMNPGMNGNMNQGLYGNPQNPYFNQNPRTPSLTEQLAENNQVLQQNDRSKPIYMNDLLAPTKVHAPATGTHKNIGAEALSEMDHHRPAPRSEGGIDGAKTEDDALPNLDNINLDDIDLKELGIDLDTIKSLDNEEDYKRAMEKLLEPLKENVNKAVQNQLDEEEEEEDEEEPDEGDLDYELVQVEDTDLTNDELKELKYVIGDTSNMTFVEKFEAADDDIRHKYLKLRFKLLTSKEKTLNSRITRYFDTYYWRGQMVARIAIQGKTIKLFLALNPKDYDNTRISVSDESAKLIYHNVPCLIRIRTDMSYKRSKKLVNDMLSARQIYVAPEIHFEEKRIVEEPVKPVEPAPAPAPEVEKVADEDVTSTIEEQRTIIEQEPANTNQDVLDGKITTETYENERGEVFVESKPEDEEESSENQVEESETEKEEDFEPTLDKEANEEHEELSESASDSNAVEFDMDENGNEINEDSQSEEDEDGESGEDDNSDESEDESSESNSDTNGNFPTEIIRRTFTEKLVYSDEELRKKYDDIKSLLVSYGMNARVAHSNETFRFKKKLFVKITVQGKGLKVFLALDPGDYVHSKIPVKDMSLKKAYSEVPTLMKVRSELSCKRAKILIEDLMAKNGIVPGLYHFVEYSKMLEDGLEAAKNYQ